eukprot:2080748-Amphidinium_carterae.1
MEYHTLLQARDTRTSLTMQKQAMTFETQLRATPHVRKGLCSHASCRCSTMEAKMLQSVDEQAASNI